MNRHLLLVASIFFFIQQIAAQSVAITLPDDYEQLDKYIGMEIEMEQTLYVTDTRNWNRYGEITLSGKRLMTPTDIALPGSEEYFRILEDNRRNQITLSDGSRQEYPNPRPWAGSDGTLRTGAYITGIKGKLTKENWGYVITPTEHPVFRDNLRPHAHENLGEHNVKLCGMNLQYYLADNYGSGYGPDDAEEAKRQHTKIIKALLTIDADVYGLVEVQQGQKAVKKLTDALNSSQNNAHYSYINDGTSANGTYTKACYIYRDDRLAPIRQLQSNDTGVKNRKKAQGFELKENGEKFIYMLGHFKAKSGNGSGDNADKNDGQGVYNGDRMREATAMTTFAKSCASYFEDNDVIIMGDLNSYSMEDPIRIIENAGYENLIKKYGGNNAYSYVFHGTAGCLDHALANKPMAEQTSGCTVFHINADEPTVFGYSGYSYQDNMYRCSDHDPVIVGLNLKKTTATANPPAIDIIIYGNNGIIGISGAEKQKMYLYSSDGLLIEERNIDTNDYTMTTGHLHPGVYIIRLITSNGNVKIEKLVIK